MIVTGQGRDLPQKYMPLLEFLGTGMKDRQAADVVYLLLPFLEDNNDLFKFVSILCTLRK